MASFVKGNCHYSLAFFESFELRFAPTSAPSSMKPTVICNFAVQVIQIQDSIEVINDSKETGTR